ncbi:sensor domain-containing diguanylate cyclase [Klebsiella aerogenes]
MTTRRQHINRIHVLYKSMVKRYVSIDETFKTILEEGVKAFDLSLGIVSQVEDDKYKLLAVSGAPDGVYKGLTLELKNTYCKKVIDDKKIISIENAGKSKNFNTHPVYINMNLESYISAPIWVRGMIWGTINFSSQEIKKEKFTNEDHEFIGLMADGIGASIEIDLLNKEKETIITSLSRSNKTLENIFENSTIGMALVSSSGQWVKVNHSLVDMLGYSKNYLLSITFQEITHHDDLEKDLALLGALSKGFIPSYQLEKRYLTAKGVYIWILLSVSIVWSANGEIQYYIAQTQNINERKNMEISLKQQRQSLAEINLELEKLASQDSLTGIANRRKFLSYLNSEIEKSIDHNQPLSLAIIDIDYFKSYNDEFGHVEGDTALINIAKILSDSQTQESMVARFGGEEFIILFPCATEDDCTMLCENFRVSVEKNKKFKRRVTVSIGAVTYYPSNHTILSFDDLLKIADAKLYEAKRSGRNKVKATRLQ